MLLHTWRTARRACRHCSVVSLQADSAYNLTRARPVADFAAAAKYADDVLEGLGEGSRAGVKKKARRLHVVGQS